MAEYRSAAGVIESGDGGCMRLIRCPTKGSLAGVVTSYQIHQLWTHYHRGRTVGCSKPNCAGCRQSCPIRYEAYCGFFNPATKAHVLLGLTVNAVRQVLDQVGRLDRLRGLHLNLFRQKNKPTGRVMVDCRTMTPDASAYPAQPDVMQELVKIWGVEHAAEVFGFPGEVQHAAPERAEWSSAEDCAAWGDRWKVVEGPAPTQLDDQLHFPGTS